MRRHGLKKGLSLLLVFCMILSLLPMTALAEEISEPSAAVEEQSPASGDTTAVDTGEDQQDEAGTGETSEAGTGETGEAGTGEAAEAGTGETGEAGTGETGEAGTGETGEAGTGEESKSTIDKITDILGDFLGTISGEKSEEEAAQDEANAKAAELALSKAAAEEAAAQQAAEEAAAKAAAEQLEADLKAVLTVEATKDARDTSGDDFYKVVHLDAGRKYFSVESIKAIIDTMAAAGYNQLELYLSDNQGFRFALDDMTITTSYGTYDLRASLGDGYPDGSKYPDGSGKYLTQDDMDTIIDYAEKNHIEIVPCINTPGHMGAILEEFSDFRYSGSRSSIDLENPKAVAFALAIVKKYADYFDGKGCNFFNIGADEYANDLSTMGFAGLYSSGKYQRFVDYLNAAAQIVINEGMTPRAFNDGIYYNYNNYKNDTSYSINKAIQVCYWSSGWGGYDLAPAATISQQGHEMINTHSDYYWVLGNSNWQCSAEKAAGFDYTLFSGDKTISTAKGAMFCIWCDVGNADGQDGGTAVVSATADVITAFGSALPVADRGNGTAEHPYVMTDAKNADVLEGLKLGESCYLTMGKEVNWKTSDPSVLKIEAVGASAVASSYVLEESEDVTATTVKVTATGIGEATLYAGTEAFDSSVEPEKEKTITVTVGKTAIETVDNANYAGAYTTEDPHIATVQVTGTNSTEPTVTYTQASVTCNTLIRRDSNNWTAANNYYYTPDGTNYYPVYAKRSVDWSWSSFAYVYTYTWGYSTTSSADNVTEIGTQSTTDTSTTPNITVYTKSTTDGTPASTIITFTGVSVGTTYVTIGDTKYTIEVKPVDLSNVTPLTVEFWITNRQVDATVNGGSAQSMSIAATETNIYSANGVLFSSLVPATGTQDGNPMVFWKGTRLASNNTQTTGGGVDKTNAGTDFAYIRYWEDGNGGYCWAYSADRVTWTNVASGDQIVAYYLQKTEVTDEITTQVVDWGVVPSTSYSSDSFVLVDFAVKYESGELTPSSFPVSGKTMAFHCASGDATVDYIGDSTRWYNRYRNIGLIRAEETRDYEVYMITVTPTNDSNTRQVAGNANTATSYTYDGTEKVIWVDDEANLGDFADESLHYTGISGDIIYSVGGDPIVPGLEIFNRHGMLVTYYVRAKVTPDSLAVHYIDQTANQEFYSYNIAVKSGTLFHENIGLANPWKGDLANGSVTNLQNKTQTVSADLSTMPAIGAQYRYSEYTCEKVARSEDGKDVYLYYTFNNTHSFVVDFGLPLDISISSDLGISGDWTDAAVTGADYGTATVSADKQTVNYTPTKVLKEIETLYLTLTGEDESTTHSTTHTIYIYPATTVYYEEGFMTLTGFTGGSKGTEKQATEAVGKKQNVYGYDGAYLKMSSSQAESNAVGNTASFSFTGTGVDIYANCGTDTGTVLITVKKGSNIVKVLTVDTHMENGLTAVTGKENNKQAVEAKNVPIASIDGLTYGDYSVTIEHVASKLGAKKSVYLDGFRVHGTLGPKHAAYNADGENSPKIVELRDLVLKVQLNADASSSDLAAYKEQLNLLTDSQIYRAAVISFVEDGYVEDGSVSQTAASQEDKIVKDLVDNGPKNEVYLAPGETLVFTIDQAAQVGVKCLNGGSGTIESTGGTTTTSVTAQTDMFYAVAAGTVTISNPSSNSGTTLAVTELKFTSNT